MLHKFQNQINENNPDPIRCSLVCVMMSFNLLESFDGKSDLAMFESMKWKWIKLSWCWAACTVNVAIRSVRKINVVMVDCSLRFFKCLTQDFIITKLNLNFQQVQELILLGQRRLFVLLQHLLAMGDNGTLQIQLPSRRRRAFSPVCRSLFREWLPPRGSPRWWWGALDSRLARDQLAA